MSLLLVTIPFLSKPALTMIRAFGTGKGVQMKFNPHLILVSNNISFELDDTNLKVIALCFESRIFLLTWHWNCYLNDSYMFILIQMFYHIVIKFFSSI